MDRGACQATVDGIAKELDMTQKLNNSNMYICEIWTIKKAGVLSCSVVFDFLQTHELQPTRLLCPWDFPGKNTGVGCHFLLQCMKVKSESEVTQLCPTLSDPMDCSLRGSSVHGIFQAKVLEWVAIAFSDIHTTMYKTDN